MPPVINEIGLSGYCLLNGEGKTGSEREPLVITVEPQAQRPTRCPCCGSAQGRFHSKGKYLRKVRHLDCFGKATSLHVHCRRWTCLAQGCGKHFVQELPGIRPGRHSSEPLRQQIYELHHQGIPARSLAAKEQLGEATIARIYAQFTQRKASERTRQECPQLLGIDEHTLHKGKRLVTTLCDLKNHKVFDLVEGRSEAGLEAYLAKLKGRENVRLICIDLSSPYRRIAQKWFPNAHLVADRFHVVRIIYQHFMTLARHVYPQMKNHRGMLTALRKRPENLSETQAKRLQTLFQACPALQPLYQKMHALRTLMNHKRQSKGSCKLLIKSLFQNIEDLQATQLQPLQTLAQTLNNWSEPIACMWRFSKNNGITEGFHRKMKLIQRRAYGFKNFNNYRLRVIAQCG